MSAASRPSRSASGTGRELSIWFDSTIGRGKLRGGCGAVGLPYGRGDTADEVIERERRVVAAAGADHFEPRLARPELADERPRLIPHEIVDDEDVDADPTHQLERFERVARAENAVA